MMRVAQSGHGEVAKRLIDFGVDLIVKDQILDQNVLFNIKFLLMCLKNSSTKLQRILRNFTITTKSLRFDQK